MRLTAFPTMACALFLITGCGEKPPPEQPAGPQFCDVEEPRRFTQEQLDWRAENDTANLRRDFKTNAAWDSFCPEAGGGKQKK